MKKNIYLTIVALDVIFDMTGFGLYSKYWPVKNVWFEASIIVILNLIGKP